jgi:hypothetical protein
MDFHVPNICRHHSPGRDNCTSTNYNTRTKYCLRTDPAPLSANNWSAKQAHVDRRPVMIAGAKICALRQAAVCFYLYVREVIDPQVLTQPGMVANLEKPGEFDPNARFYVHTPADLCSEYAQQPAPKRRRRNQRRS